MKYIDTILYGPGKHDGVDLQLSRLAKMRLDEVRPHHVVAWLEELADSAVAKRSIELAYDTLSSLLGRAVDLGFIETNPAAGAKRRWRKRSRRDAEPLEPGRVVDPLNIEGVRRHLELVCAMRDWLIMGLMAYIGFRPSELVVFYWHELIDEHGRARSSVKVERGLSDTTEVDTPKQGKWRLVTVFEPVRSDIERYYESCGRPSRDERVFLTLKGNLLSPNHLGDNLRRHMRAAGVPMFRPYDLRHTCASLLLGGGDEANPGKPWSMTEIAEQLGHSVEVCATTYLHVVKNPLYRGMPIEQVIWYAKETVAAERPGTPWRDGRRSRRRA